MKNITWLSVDPFSIIDRLNGLFIHVFRVHKYYIWFSCELKGTRFFLSTWILPSFIWIFLPLAEGVVHFPMSLLFYWRTETVSSPVLGTYVHSINDDLSERKCWRLWTILVHSLVSGTLASYEMRLVWCCWNDSHMTDVEICPVTHRWAAQPLDWRRWCWCSARMPWYM